MNQQEIDRLWDENKIYISECEDSGFYMQKDNFEHVAAEIRKQALEEALQIVRDAREQQYRYKGFSEEWFNGFDSGIDESALAIRSKFNKT